MSTITIEVPDELSDLITEARDRLPELLAQSLKQPALAAHIYRHVLDFLPATHQQSKSHRLLQRRK